MKEKLIKLGFNEWLNTLNIAPYPIMFWDIPEIVKNAYIHKFLIDRHFWAVIIERDDYFFVVKTLEFKSGNKYNKICFDFDSYEEAFIYGLNHIIKKINNK